MRNIIYIHGLESSGMGFKGRLLKNIFPEILTPDFEPHNSNISIKSLLKKRMLQLDIIINEKENWIIIGSSYGGLMGALYSLKHPKKVKMLILLAPFFGANLLNPSKFHPIDVPIVIFHGKNDLTASLKKSKTVSNILFSNLEYNIVDDDHYLHTTVKKINWIQLIGKNV
ncbi:MAG: alpha/beta hydrolase [Candidatus Lokiarchaeota archaeon]|nr:alpha/beta hydrolase [Candidatus Lokiarchaeota archaeon]